jgi:hypothetical protein
LKLWVSRVEEENMFFSRGGCERGDSRWCRRLADVCHDTRTKEGLKCAEEAQKIDGVLLYRLEDQDEQHTNKLWMDCIS